MEILVMSFIPLNVFKIESHRAKERLPFQYVELFPVRFLFTFPRIYLYHLLSGWKRQPVLTGKPTNQGVLNQLSRRPRQAFKSSLCSALTTPQDFHKTKLKQFSPWTGFYDKSKKFLQFNCFCQLQELF